MTHVLIGLVLATSALACGDDKDKTAVPASSTPGQTVQAVSKPAIDRELLPLRVLAEVESFALTAQPPCSQHVETAKPALEAITTTERALTADESGENAPELLLALAKSIESALPAAVAEDAPDDEAWRSASELRAALADLAEGCSLLSKALVAGNRQEAELHKRRIENGVANLRISIEQLTSLCAP